MVIKQTSFSYIPMVYVYVVYSWLIHWSYIYGYVVRRLVIIIIIIHSTSGFTVGLFILLYYTYVRTISKIIHFHIKYVFMILAIVLVFKGFSMVFDSTLCIKIHYEFIIFSCTIDIHSSKIIHYKFIAFSCTYSIFQCVMIHWIFTGDINFVTNKMFMKYH